ncbi:uncharacterized protein [Drosophila virilis]|uniref:Uncharacterized protein n=1 Tax=Drosophila virilis TaxID=7244 RepID=B4LKK0_DROVI|nr:uncharacterized protein LOC6626975 [Drosophila virilis]EDW60721.2 uncharacterized protein Dvir_GJ20700 [Drosophila virilis]
MLSRVGLFSTKMLQQNTGHKPSRLSRRYSKTKVPKTEEPKPEKKPCRLGAQPRNVRDPPEGYAPTRLKTKKFKIPPFVKPKIFRCIEKKEKLGPNAGKCECYKNPEYYSYHRFSYYELMMAANAVKACTNCCK